MYDFLLIIHSWLRWAVLLLALITIYKSLVGFKGSNAYEKSDNIISASFVGTIHLMALIGLGLYFTSPYAFNAFGGGESVMKNATLRFWAVEHVFVMVIAVVLATIGRAKSKKKSNDQEKFKVQLIFFSIALLLMLSRIPWSEAERIFRF